MPSARNQRKVYKDLIEDAIIEAILSGELKMGDRVIEMDWAEKFGSSQAPVREAIRDLEGRGVLESKPFKGASVRVVGKEELREIHSIRAGLETVALTKVIRDVSDEDVKRLKKRSMKCCRRLKREIPGRSSIRTRSFMRSSWTSRKCRT